jgi:transposase-like protein
MRFEKEADMARGNVVSDRRKATQGKVSAEEKIRVVIEELRGGIPVSELCRHRG